MVDPANPETSVVNAVKQLQDDTQGYMDRVTNGDVLDYDMLQLEVGDAKNLVSPVWLLHWCWVQNTVSSITN